MTNPSATTIDTAERIAALRTAFNTGRTRPREWRAVQLRGMLRFLEAEEDGLVSALGRDLGRPSYEGWLLDIAATRQEIQHLLSKLGSWMTGERKSTPLVLFPASSQLVPEPLGVTLTIAPWNAPVFLLLSPMAAAIAAGNAVLGKPSELAPTVSSLIASRLPHYVDGEAIAILEGGINETTALLEQRFDHIFYTGNGRVGRIVAAAAAKHLTPVTLELGGKCPVIVDRDANLGMAANRIVWGRFLNAGQLCVAPDYLLAHREIHDELVDRIATLVEERYGEDPRASDDFGRIVNEAHTERLAGLIDAGGYRACVCGGKTDVAARYVAPTVLTGVDPSAAVMQEEIFGPILPVLPFDHVEAAIDFVNARDKPLALYVFAGSKQTVEAIIERTSSGSVMVNDLMSHLANFEIPFGGVGESGSGASHGRFGFDTFSHLKPIVRRPKHWFDHPVATPPYSPWKWALARRFA